SAAQLSRTPLGSPMGFGLQHLMVLTVVVAACHRPTEIRGVYLNHEGSGVLFPCDNPQRLVRVADSVLAARYHSVVSGTEPAFVRLRGIKGHAGSPKGGPTYYFLVHDVLEIRLRTKSDCPGIAPSLARFLAGS
ncbi:MAG: hypothetical protein ACREQ8_05150, partial [Woeseiaceae bacterium]